MVYGGTCIRATGVIYNTGDTLLGDDALSSFHLELGWAVQLCKDTDLDGQCAIFTEGDTDLADGPFANDAASSLRVWRLPDAVPVLAVP